MRTFRGRPLSARELRRLDGKKRSGRYIAVDNAASVGGFSASADVARPVKRRRAA